MIDLPRAENIWLNPFGWFAIIVLLFAGGSLGVLFYTRHQGIVSRIFLIIYSGGYVVSLVSGFIFLLSGNSVSALTYTFLDVGVGLLTLSLLYFMSLYLLHAFGRSGG